MSLYFSASLVVCARDDDDHVAMAMTAAKTVSVLSGEEETNEPQGRKGETLLAQGSLCWGELPQRHTMILILCLLLVEQEILVGRDLIKSHHLRHHRLHARQV